MRMSMYALLLRVRFLCIIALALVSCGCPSFELMIMVCVGALVVFGLIATLLTGELAFDLPEHAVYVEEDSIRATHGSRAPVRFSKLVEVGWVCTGSDEWSDEMLYFLRDADGAWCAFPTHMARSALDAQLARLEGFEDVRVARFEDGLQTRRLWKLQAGR
jgi:hypothetical protein